MTDMVPADDRGLLLGDGLFETVLFKAGRAVLWQAHLDRLVRGCVALGLPTPDANELTQAMARAIDDSGLGQTRAAVRISWTAGSGARGLERPSEVSPRLLVSAALAPGPQAPVALALSPIRRNETSPAARHKTLAYLDNVMARRQARLQGAGEAVMLNSRGELACCSAANLFWLVGDRVFTPALDCGVLDGIMRAQVLAAAPGLGLEPVEVCAPLQALEGVDGLFISNCLIGVRPAVAPNAHPVRQGPAVEALALALTEVC